jgi:ankyrin repeat protein
MPTCLASDPGMHMQRLCAAGARVNCKDRLRWTPLAYASYNGHVDVVKILLETGGCHN